MSPESGKRWYETLYPIAQAGGPVLTLGLAVVMAISVYWMNSWITDCANHNRVLSAQLVAQQQAFHSEILVHLSRCAQPPRQ